MPYRHWSYKSGLKWLQRVRWLLATAVLVALIIGAAAWLNHDYHQNLLAVSDSQKAQVITIQPGSSVKDIAAQLQKAKLIRNARF